MRYCSYGDCVKCVYCETEKLTQCVNATERVKDDYILTGSKNVSQITQCYLHSYLRLPLRGSQLYVQCVTYTFHFNERPTVKRWSSPIR